MPVFNQYFDRRGVCFNHRMTNCPHCWTDYSSIGEVKKAKVKQPMIHQPRPFNASEDEERFHNVPDDMPNSCFGLSQGKGIFDTRPVETAVAKIERKNKMTVHTPATWNTPNNNAVTGCKSIKIDEFNRLLLLTSNGTMLPSVIGRFSQQTVVIDGEEYVTGGESSELFKLAKSEDVNAVLQRVGACYIAGNMTGLGLVNVPEGEIPRAAVLLSLKERVRLDGEAAAAQAATNAAAQAAANTQPVS